MPAQNPDLSAWLSRLEALHPQSIDLGLERIAKAWQRLAVDLSGIPIISIAGTNGKGSSQAMLEAIYQAQGYSTGVYSSPHLLRYNERIRLHGQPVTDADICKAFVAVEAARGDISLTYFEFGTLAAFWLFAQARPDLLILEVGLGGRLDAVNILDADVALITSIDYDHQDWLGTNIDQIAREKAGILRSGRIGVFNGSQPPQGLMDAAAEVGAGLWLRERDYGYECTQLDWSWWQGESRLEKLPLPALIGAHQCANAAAVLAVTALLQQRLPLNPEALCQGLRSVRLSGRFQVIAQAPELILDVAHNPEAARSLAASLRVRPCQGRTLALFGIMADKDAAAVVAEFIPLVDAWLVAAPGVSRAMSAEALVGLLKPMGAKGLEPYPSLAEAFIRARALAGPDDRILVFGSFFTLAEVLKLL